jgi:pyruvate/2-oxoacid:ferredoxin oxidoreductase beta subunit
MNIFDLNYLEVATEEVVGGTGTKDVSLATSVKQKYAADVVIQAKKDIKSMIAAETKVKGNSAINFYENTALGANTYTESNVSNTTIAGKLSESSGLLISAASH